MQRKTLENSPFESGGTESNFDSSQQQATAPESSPFFPGQTHSVQHYPSKVDENQSIPDNSIQPNSEGQPSPGKPPRKCGGDHVVIPDTALQKLRESSEAQCTIFHLLASMCHNLMGQQELLEEVQRGLSKVNQVLCTLRSVLEEIEAANKSSEFKTPDIGDALCVLKPEPTNLNENAEVEGLDVADKDNHESIDDQHIKEETDDSGEESNVEMIECQVDILDQVEDACLDQHPTLDQNVIQNSVSKTEFIAGDSPSTGRKRKDLEPNEDLQDHRYKHQKVDIRAKMEDVESLRPGLTGEDVARKNFHKSQKIRSYNRAKDVEPTCPVCGMMKESKEKLKMHLLSHYHKNFLPFLTKSRPFKCPECAKEHRDFIILIRHYAFAHDRVNMVLGFDFRQVVEDSLRPIGKVVFDQGERGLVPHDQEDVDLNVSDISKPPDNRVNHDHSATAVRPAFLSQVSLSASLFTDMQPTCNVCGLTKENREKMRMHLLSHYHNTFRPFLTKSRPFRCPECNKEHRDYLTLIRHYAFGHDKINTVLGFDFRQAVEMCMNPVLNSVLQHQQGGVPVAARENEQFDAEDHINNKMMRGDGECSIEEKDSIFKMEM